jgi:hypothetical protein
MRSRRLHEEWMKKIKVKVLIMEGNIELSRLLEMVLNDI